MIRPLGQLAHLPDEVAGNPFHRLILQFSRAKAGSFEELFTAEAWLLRYAWLGLIVLCALVAPPLEDYPLAGTLVRLLTLVYPAFFIWSLTRLAGVELMQLMLEGQWTPELLATPLSSRSFMDGFVAPVWIVLRQYLLISVFSLALNTLETHVVAFGPNNELYLGDMVRSGVLGQIVFFSAIGWIVFLYLGRLLTEVRLRSGLLKGLITLFLMSGGLIFLAFYGVIFYRYPNQMLDTPVLAGLAALTAALFAGAAWFNRLLKANFRRYFEGHLDLDPLIFDDTDPRATAWEKIEPPMNADEH